MSVAVTAGSRLATATLRLTRLAVRHLGLGPVALALAAAAALAYILRPRPHHAPPQQRRRTRRHRQPAAAAAATTSAASADAPRSQPTLPGPKFLARVRRVTYGARWTRADRCHLFFEPPCDPVSADKKPDPSGIKLRPEAVPSLRELASRFDLYFITQVDSGPDEDAVVAALNDVGLMEPGLLDPRKVLFCETDLGRVSVARQIDPHLHFDESPAVVEGLERFIPWIAYVSPNANDAPAVFTRKVLKYTSLASFFSE